MGWLTNIMMGNAVDIEKIVQAQQAKKMAAEQAAPQLPMKTTRSTKSCTKCQCTALWHVLEVAANTDTGSAQLQPPFKLAVVGNGEGGTAGPMEAYACQMCGFTEFYLKHGLRADGVHVVEVLAADPLSR